MAQTSIIINTTDPNGKALQKTLTDANGACSSAVLTNFGQMLTGLTNNTYQNTNRVSKHNCDTEEVPVIKEKIPGVISVTSGMDEYYNYTFTYNGDGEIYVNTFVSLAGGDASMQYAKQDSPVYASTCDPGKIRVCLESFESRLGEYGEVRIYAPETENYTACSATIVIDI